MTSTRSPLVILSDQLVQFLRTEGGSRAITRFTEAGLRRESANDLVVLGLPGRTLSRARRARIVEVLAALAPSDGIAALCVVVALRPDLKRMIRRSTRELVDTEDTEADVLAIAWETVIEGPDDDSHGFRHAMLVNTIWAQVRTAAGLRRGHLETVRLVHDYDQEAPPDDPLERWPGLLASAVARGVLTPRQVVVIAQTRVEGRPLVEVAAALGRTYDSLRMERARAESALRQFTLSYYESEEQ